jgi:hypothetical protein
MATNRSFSFLSGTVGAGVLLANAQVGRNFSELLDAASKIISGSAPQLRDAGVSVRIVPAPTSATMLSCNVLIIVGQKAGVDGAPCISTYLVQPAGRIEPMMIPTASGQQVPLERGAEDFVDAQFMASLDSYVQRQLGAPATNIGSFVLADQVKFTGDTSVLSTALLSIVAHMLPTIIDPTGANTTPLALRQLAERLSVTAQTGQFELTTPTGQGVNPPILVSITVAPEKKPGGASVHQETPMTVAQMGVYPDFVAAPTSVRTPDGQVRTLPFAPRAVIRTIGLVQYELEPLLLAIAAATAGVTNRFWATPALMGRMNYDLGVLAKIAGGERVQGLNGTAVDTDVISNYLDTLVSSNVAVTLAIGRSTPADSLMTCFVQAARGDSNGTAAIHQAAKNLLGSDWTYTGPVAIVTGSTSTGSGDVIPAGYTVDRNGVTVPLSSVLDTVTLATLTNCDPSVVSNWVRLRNLPADMHPVHSLCQVQALLKTWMSPVFTGVEVLVTLHPDFLDALAKGVQASAAALGVQANNPFQAAPSGLGAASWMTGAGFNGGLRQLAPQVQFRGAVGRAF